MTPVHKDLFTSLKGEEARIVQELVRLLCKYLLLLTRLTDYAILILLPEPLLANLFPGRTLYYTNLYTGNTMFCACVRARVRAPVHDFKLGQN